jgi:hypothetical protein
MATCLLCGRSGVKRIAIGADLFQYNCPVDEPFVISGSHEAVLQGDHDVAAQKREWVARHRKTRPDAIPRVE